MSSKLRRLSIVVAVALFWLGVWALCSHLINQELLLPTPWVTLVTLVKMMGQSTFWVAVGVSFLRVLGGFVAAVVVGVLLAVLTTRFAILHTVLSPLLYVVRAAPVASFIILAFVWLRAGVLPAFIAFLMVVPLVWENVRRGILEIDVKLLEMAQVFRLNRRNRVRLIWVPSVKPYFEAAVITGFGFAWKSGIAAEIICWPDRSIGQNMHAAKAYLETPEVIAWTLVVVVLSVVLEHLLKRFMKGKGVSV